MATIRLSWKNPTTRVNGRALSPDAIAYVRVDASIDGGATFTELARVTGETFEQTDAEPGEWRFRLTVVDKQTPPKSSVAVSAVANVADAEPSPVLDVVVTVV